MSRPYKHRQHYLADPMRVILDISKDPAGSRMALSEEMAERLREAMPMKPPFFELPPEY